MRKITFVKLVLESISFVVTLYGLWQIIRIMRPSPTILRYVIVAVLLIAIAFPLIYRLTRPPLLREYNLPPISKEFLVTSHKIEVTIQKTGAKAMTSRDYTFIKKPKKGDLYDLVEVTGEIAPHMVHYNSPDSDQIEFERRNRNKLIIYWKPKSEVYPYTIYPHRFSWTPSVRLDDDINYFFISPTYLTGITSIEIQTYRAINESFAFTTKKLFKDEESVYRYAIFLKKTSLPQPLVDDSRLAVRLEISNPKPGIRHYLVWSHDKSIVSAWLDLAEKKLGEIKRRKKYARCFSFDYYRLKKAVKTTRTQ